MSSQTITSTPSNKPDTWKNRIAQASIFLGKTKSEVEAILKSFGIEEQPAGLEMLSDEEVTPFGDFRKIFCDDNKVPVLKLRMAMKFLRGPKDSKKADDIDPELMAIKEKFGIKLKLENIETSELLPYYHPDKPSHPVTLALKQRYGDKAIIAFKPDSKEIAIEETVNYITDVEMGYAEEENIEVDGSLVRLYPIGQIPDQIIEEDPIFAGNPLKRGRSTVNRVNWSGVDLETQQLCRIIVERSDIDINDRFAVKKLVELAIKSNGIKELKKMFPEAEMKFREKRKTGDLPKLRMTLNDMVNKKQDPFGIKG